MEMALEKWISELETDEYFIDQCPNHTSEFDEYVQLLGTLCGTTSSESQSCGATSDQKCHSNASTTTTTTTAACGGVSVEIYRASLERPPTQLKMDNTPNATVTTEEANETIERSLEPKDGVLCNGDKNEDLNGGKGNDNAPKPGQKRSNAMTRTPLETHDRVMAERKRREKLSERFITLSTMVPGLKKMDKVSVLGDAIRYLKELQENVKSLEEKVNKKSEEWAVLGMKSHTCMDDDTSSRDENFDGHFNKEALPEIEARISEKSVLIRIHCEKQKGFVVKLLSEIEKLHLIAVNSSFLPFGQHAIDVTLVAQMEAEFSMTVKELVRNLQSAFTKFM